MKVKLLVVRGQPQGKSLVFPRGEFVIGRGNECHIRPNSDWVSRQHCMLCVAEERVTIRDLGSTNGTLVNGSRILDEFALSHGDQVQVGPLVFEVRLEQVASALDPVHTPLPTGTIHPGVTPGHNLETAEMPNMGTETTPTIFPPNEGTSPMPAAPIHVSPPPPAPPKNLLNQGERGS
jgi:predicted component of type VI protein secretion system